MGYGGPRPLAEIPDGEVGLFNTVSSLARSLCSHESFLFIQPSKYNCFDLSVIFIFTPDHLISKVSYEKKAVWCGKTDQLEYLANLEFTMPPLRERLESKHVPKPISLARLLLKRYRCRLYH